ncbi:low temperature requirement protein A [Micromonospora sp. NPDC048930]|uniref:low temperature requirement protein A n=1 Tax=Micromonospora sp. NPDC048930 TaxID=3364261 RepID=UPI003723BF96
MAKIDSAQPGRHASWLELFFDLVVVAAIFELAHRLHGTPTLRSVGVFLVLYLAVWIAWTSFTLYGNVAGEDARRRAMLLGMFGIAVMAAAVPEATGERARVFAGAYVVVRILGQLSWAGTRQTLLAWPTAQVGLGLAPWIVSLMVGSPARYVLWVVGLAIDLLLPILLASQAGQIPPWAQRLMEREAQRAATGAAKRGLGRVEFREARLDLAHLAERLGLFVIIVLGEGVMQLVTTAAGVAWTSGVVAVAVAGFVLLIGLWWPTFRYGLLATESGRMPVRAGMPLHFLTVTSITVIAAGLGTIMEHPHGHAPSAVRWLLCGGVAVYFLDAALGAVIVRQPLHWLLGWGLPGTAAPLVLAAIGGWLPGVLMVWLLVMVVGWQAAYVWLAQRRGHRA